MFSNLLLSMGICIILQEAQLQVLDQEALVEDWEQEVPIEDLCHLGMVLPLLVANKVAGGVQIRK